MLLNVILVLENKAFPLTDQILQNRSKITDQVLPEDSLNVFILI